MNIGIVIQARLTSIRFPNKVLANLEGKPVLQHVLDELSKCNIPIVVAIPASPANDELYNWLVNSDIDVYRGREHDVLDRFYQCAKLHKFDIIIRICGENPLICYEDVLENLQKFQKQNRFIYGMHSWIFSFKMLEWAWANCAEAETREHVVRAFMNTIDYNDDLKRLESGIIW